MNIEQSTLPNGLRIVSTDLPHVESVSMGIWIGVGARYEPKSLSGVSHFIEHLLFKGTRRRSAKDISQSIEGRGGYVNAFTQEENTCYYARVGYDRVREVFDILADMYRNSRFHGNDIEMERNVIMEELMMYNDQPHHLVQEMLSECMWRNHALGRPLIGTPRSLGALSRERIVSFKESRYTSTNTVCAFAGRIDHNECIRLVRRHFGRLKKRRQPGCTPVSVQTSQRRSAVLAKEMEQAQLALGFRLFGRRDSRRYALQLLNVALGANMSSRLFQVVREKHGMAYAIHSSAHLFSDTGALIVSAGVDAARTDKALKLVVRELKKLKDRRIGPAELKRAKDYVVGQIRLGLESTSQNMMWLGEHVISSDKVMPPEDAIKRIMAVDASQVQKVAAYAFRLRRASVALVSPGADSAAESRLNAGLRNIDA